MSAEHFPISDWKELETIPFDFTYKGRTKPAQCQTIMTFDIETSNLYTTNGVESYGYNYDEHEQDPDKFDNADKFSCMYIWQFGIEYGDSAKVFIGRTWEEFRLFLSQLSHALYNARYGVGRVTGQKNSDKPVYANIYIHNLGFEFQHLRNLFDHEFAETRKHTKHDKVFARSAHKPLKATVRVDNDLMVVFKDSLVLTNKSLANWCKDAELPVSKLKPPEGYYDIIRTPETKLTEFELQYAVYDVVSMVHGIKQYRKKYETMENIPMTQTGQIRLVCAAKVGTNREWARKCLEMTCGTSYETFRDLTYAFCGGWTHANAFKTGKILHNARCFDFASSYPFGMTSFKYPVTAFKPAEDITKAFEDMNKIDPRSLDIDKKYIVKLRLTNIRSKMYNTFWSFSKTQSGSGEVIDNGKLTAAKEITVTMTDLDWHIFKEAYSIGSIEVEKVLVADAELLPKEMLNTILSYYQYKTSFKGLDDKLSQYNEAKQFINSIYGVFVTKLFDDSIRFMADSDGAGQWVKTAATREDYQDIIDKSLKKLDKIKKGKDANEYLSYGIGVFVTAYARSSLWQILLKLDSHVAYGDTDSLKGEFTDEDMKVINEYNDWVRKRHKEVAEMAGIDAALYTPIAPNGKEKPLGLFAEEDPCIRFKTLGAKRYADEIEIPIEHYNPKKHVLVSRTDKTAVIFQATISGIPKHNAEMKIKNVENFVSGLAFTPRQSGKKIHYYNDEQPVGVMITDRDGNEYELKDKFGMMLMPTTFSVEQSNAYKAFLNLINGITKPRMAPILAEEIKH